MTRGKAVQKIKKIIEKLRYILSHKDQTYFCMLTVAAVIGSVLELIGVTVFMPFINMIMNPQASIKGNKILYFIYYNYGFKTYKSFLIFIAVIIICVYVVKNIYLIWQKKVTYTYSFSIQQKLATKLLDAYMSEPYTFHRNKNIADMQRSLEMDVSNFAQFIMHLLQMIAELMVCILLGLYLLKISKTICCVVAGLLIICVYIFTMTTKKTSKGLGRDCQQYRSKIYQWINQSLGGIKEVKILEREDYFVDSFTDYYKKYADGLAKCQLIGAMPKNIIEAVCMSGILLATIVKLKWGQADMIYFIPQLTVFAVAAFRLMPSAGRINEYMVYIINTMPSVDLVYHDLKEVEKFEKARAEEVRSDWKFSDRIRVEKMSYHYPDSNENVIDNVSFEIPKGKTVAFIGASGAGKTTIADIILGLLSPSSGHVYADGLDIHNNATTWHKEIGYIPQNIYLSDSTIRENIAFGIKSDEVDEKSIRMAVKQAQLEEFIKGLPDGLDSFVGDRGVRISGGQRQRIGIARALYNNPEVLVLDEATSALDNETEKAVMESIDGLKGVKTLIIIAHRLTTIRNADIVFEVEKGQVIQKSVSDIL
jgi:ABC-type multidrug transport system fused ATPase/permease subunit